MGFKAPASLAPVLWNSKMHWSRSLSASFSRPSSSVCVWNFSALSTQRCCSGWRRSPSSLLIQSMPARVAAGFGRGARQFTARALDHRESVRLAESFEIKAVGHVLRRLLLSANHVEGCFQRHVKHTTLSRRREVADAAALSGMKRIKMRLRDAFPRIGERKEAAGKIGPRAALEF